ncbi:hypothetical protein RHGRI_004756 [Rhododendron griersonianum]|uniref:Uncharacterized protein n=1 Tax=Rhododendron griersonianum TaxID=479676 RepID=A0AAV6LB09_9ERIC|nr:hypothetical protein RHGRI_004756 [Rhododendron griersonianum]
MQNFESPRVLISWEYTYSWGEGLLPSSGRPSQNSLPKCRQTPIVLLFNRSSAMDTKKEGKERSLHITKYEREREEGFSDFVREGSEIPFVPLQKLTCVMCCVFGRQ